MISIEVSEGVGFVLFLLVAGHMGMMAGVLVWLCHRGGDQ
jgi:hypothetical protein